LWFATWLSIGIDIEIDLLDTTLPVGVRFGFPSTIAELDFA
jgi:hypothetical protein